MKKITATNGSERYYFTWSEGIIEMDWETVEHVNPNVLVDGVYQSLKDPIYVEHRSIRDMFESEGITVHTIERGKPVTFSTYSNLVPPGQMCFAITELDANAAFAWKMRFG